MAQVGFDKDSFITQVHEIALVNFKAGFLETSYLVLWRLKNTDEVTQEYFSHRHLHYCRYGQLL